MPLGLAAARRRRPTLEAAVRRPSDQSGPISTTWPRLVRGSIVAFGTRFSTTSTQGRAVRGQNEIGKCSECHAGASIASCRFSLAWTWRRKNCVVHWSCWSPPGEPQAMYGSTSRWHIVGESVVRGGFAGGKQGGGAS